MVVEIGVFVGDLPADRALDAGCRGVVTAGAKHHRAQGLLVETKAGSTIYVTQAESVIARIKGRCDAIKRPSQGEAIPIGKARRDLDTGSRGLAAVLIREDELVVEHNGAVVLLVACSQADAAADHGFLVNPRHAHRAGNGRAPLGREAITVGIQNLPGNRAAATCGQAGGAAAVGDRTQQRLIISHAGGARKGQGPGAVVVAAVDAGDWGIGQLVAAQPARGDAHHRLLQLGVVRITQHQPRSQGYRRTGLGK